MAVALALVPLFCAIPVQGQVFRVFAGQSATQCLAAAASPGVALGAETGKSERMAGGSIGRFTGQYLDFSLGGLTSMCTGQKSAILAFGTITLYPATLFRRLSLGGAVSGDVDFNQMGITLDPQGANKDPYLWVRPEAAARLFLFRFGKTSVADDGTRYPEGGTSLELRFGRYRNRANYATAGMSIHFNR